MKKEILRNIIKENFKNKLSFKYEVIFVDDNSSDGTLSIMQEEKKNNLDIEIKIVKGEVMENQEQLMLKLKIALVIIV